MKRDSRLSSVLHVILHMAEFQRPVTSEELARMLGSNPVVVRRLLAGLRYAGFVASEKGHGGGWVLSCPLETVTLGDVHAALGAPRFLAVGHRAEAPSCLVEQAVNQALSDVYDQAEALVVARLGQITLAELSRDFHRRLQSTGSFVKHKEYLGHVL